MVRFLCIVFHVFLALTSFVTLQNNHFRDTTLRIWELESCFTNANDELSGQGD